MPLLQPPITGDTQLDSWTYELTNQINQGLLPGGVTGGDFGGPSGGGGGGGNSLIYLYQRTTSRALTPMRPTTVTYDLTQLPIVSSADNGWSSEIPDTALGTYLWVTFRYVSASSGVVMDANSWDTPVILSVTTATDNQERVVIADSIVGYDDRFLDRIYATTINGDNAQKNIEDLPTAATELFQGVRNETASAVSMDPADFTFRQVDFTGDIGQPQGVTNNSFNPQIDQPDSGNEFRLRSWDYDPATFLMTLHTNRNNVNFNTAGGLPNPSMTFTFARQGETPAGSSLFTTPLTLVAGAQADGADDVTCVVPNANRNAFNAAGNVISIEINSPGRLLSNAPVGTPDAGVSQTISFLDGPLLVNQYFGTGVGSFYRTTGRRNIDWVFADERPTNFAADPVTAAIDLDDITSGIEGIEGAPGPAGTDGANAVSVRIDSMRLPANVSTPQLITLYDSQSLDFSTFRVSNSGAQFRNDTGEDKALIVTVQIGGVDQDDAAHYTYEYAWSRNGLTFSPSISPQNLARRFIVITPDDVEDGGEDQFLCTAVDPNQ